MDEKNRSTRSEGPKVCCCAGEFRARIMACSVIFYAITIGYRRKGVSPFKGGKILGLEGSSYLDELLSASMLRERVTVFLFQ